MNELMILKISEEGKETVSAKELYLGLGLNETNWSKWYQNNIENNEFFKENVDWALLVMMTSVNKRGNFGKDFEISLEFAKHIAMMARTEKSHQYRNYFIRCEEKAKELMIENYKLKLEMQTREMKYLQGQSKLAESLFYAHNTINAEKGVSTYMPSIILDILKSTKDKAIIKQDDKLYYFNFEDVKIEFLKYEIKPTRFKELLESLGGCKTSIFITGKNKRQYRYECYVAPKYLIDCKL